MADPEKTDEKFVSKKSKWFRRIFWVVFVAGIFLYIGLIALSRVGGNDESYKIMAEGTITDLTGYQTQIGKLNWIGFYPNTIFDMDDVVLSKFDTGDAITVGHISIVSDFWDLKRKNGKFKDARIENLIASAGTILNETLEIEKISVYKPDDQSLELPPILRAEGMIADKKVLLQFDLNEGKDTFSLPEERPVKFELGAYKGSFLLKDAKDALIFDHFELFYSDQIIGKGVLQLSREENAVSLLGNIDVREQKRFEYFIDFFASVFVAGTTDFQNNIVIE